MEQVPSIKDDFWQSLKKHTAARIALGKAGSSINTQELLKFQQAHSLACDAVHTPLDEESVLDALKALGQETLQLSSQVEDRQQYLLRPDWGKKLSDESKNQLNTNNQSYDIALIVGDGLSSQAIQKHIAPLFKILLPKLEEKNYQLAPISLVKNARVAISDEIGQLLQCKMAVIFIGERPGLSSADSLGIYLTYAPQVGNTDEKRNCISNVRPEGMPYVVAAEKLSYLIQESFKKELSGVSLKDDLQISLEG